tara:strand:- start:1634 stop:1888 length:255 start_codon:yes stop_codon:yes gene_type:complete
MSADQSDLFRQPRKRSGHPDEAAARRRQRQNEYQARRREVLKEAGFVARTVWIPEEFDDRLSRYIKKLVRECGREMPSAAQKEP